MSIERLSVLFTPLLLLLAGPVCAATGGTSLPWDAPVNALVDNMTGPLAKAAVIAAAAVAAYIWMFSEHSAGVKQLSKVVFGGSLLILGAQFLSALGLDGAIL